MKIGKSNPLSKAMKAGKSAAKKAGKAAKKASGKAGKAAGKASHKAAEAGRAATASGLSGADVFSPEWTRDAALFFAERRLDDVRVATAPTATDRKTLCADEANHFFTRVRGAAAKAAGEATDQTVSTGLKGWMVYPTVVMLQWAGVSGAARGGFEAAGKTDPFSDDLAVTLRTIAGGASDGAYEETGSVMQAWSGWEAGSDYYGESAGNSVERAIAGDD